jgi:hypothetical protein
MVQTYSMKLSMISEMQRKWPTTNMDRTNVTGSYGVASVNDYCHLVHPNAGGHGQSSNKKKPKVRKK